MRTIFKIARTELQTLFYSPIAWLVLVIFGFQSGMMFADMFTGVVMGQEMGYSSGNITYNIFAHPTDGIFSMIANYLYLYIPLLTMSLMSREFGSGSISLLYSSPVTNLQIILGKYLSMMLYGLVLVGMLLVFALFGSATVKDFDFPVVLSGLLGIYLIVCAYSAVGLFMSCLTSYQVVAAILTLCMLAMLTYVRDLWQGIDFVRDITYWLSISGRSEELINGLICSEDVIYFIIVSALFLAFSVIRLQACRQKTPLSMTFGKYVGVLAVVCVVGYFSSRPALMTYYDTTATKVNTLTKNSQDVVSKSEGGLTITTYVNLLDGQGLWDGMPESRNDDIQRFKQYIRFKPEIKMKYVYYYDTIPSDSWEKYYPGMTIDEIARDAFKNYRRDSAMFLKPAEIRKLVDLSEEGNTFVRLLERESGEKTFLRVYDDWRRHPTEAEITAALKRVVLNELPNVGFLTGHGERDNKHFGDRNYYSFSLDRHSRNALINQGFDVVDVNLQREIPADIRMLVVAEMKETLTQEEQVNLDQYIARGGNLLIMSEPKRSEAMRVLLAEFGVRQVPGTLVRLSENFSPDLVLGWPTKEAGELSYYFNDLRSMEACVSMPSVSGLEYDTDKGYTVVPLFMSDSTTWNELKTTDFVDEVPTLDVAEGEEQKSYATALALSRKVGDREQKILIFGDADCISNGEISMSRNDIESINFSVITGSFFWMSDGEAPVDIRRPRPTDNHVSLSESSASVWSIVWKWIFPGLMVLAAVLIWIRRRGR